MQAEGASEGEEEWPVCRICLEQEHEDNLVRPCNCSGTQAYTHASCMRAWQQVTDLEQSFVCPVCKGILNLPGHAEPPSPSPVRLLYSLPALIGSVAFAFFPLALLASIPLLVRSSWIIPLSIIVTLLASFYVNNLRAVLRFDRHGRPIIRFIRTHTGHPLPQVRAGALLVAEDSLPPNSIFQRSVILLTCHSPSRGSYGVVLNMEQVGPPPGHPLRPARHSVGGPVDDEVVLHRNQGVSGARPLPDGLAVGGDAHEIVDKAEETGGVNNSVRVFHGVASWAPRQLDGEVWHGTWRVAGMASCDVVFGESSGLWDGLMQQLRE